MSAVVIIGQLLKARVEVTDLVPPARIYIGAIPLNAVLPSIGITDVGGDEIETVARNGTHSTMTGRVQVTVYSKDYALLDRILKACKLPGVPRGILGTIKVNSVLPAGVGPVILPDGDDIYERSRDYMVTFKEAN